MSKAKGLARVVEDLYSRSKIWDMNINSEISDIVYLSVDLCRAVLSEPEPDFKGWIEVDVLQADERHETQCINLTHVTDFGITPRGPTYICLTEGGSIIVKESYDEIKQMIRRAS